MRALAQFVRARASSLESISHGVKGTVDAMVYEGPAARDLKSEISVWGFTTIGVYSELSDLAALLEHEATKVAELQEQARLEALRRAHEQRDAREHARSGR